MFLTLLSYALIYASTLEDPTQYSGRADGLRAFCEVITIIFLMFYFVEEINQAERWVQKTRSLESFPAVIEDFMNFWTEL